MFEKVSTHFNGVVESTNVNFSIQHHAMHVIRLEPFGYMNVRPFLCPTTSFLEDANLLFCQFTVFFHTLFILLSWFLLLFQSASCIPLLPQGVALGCIPFGASPRLCASYLSKSSAYFCSLIYHQCVDRTICTYTERAIGGQSENIYCLSYWIWYASKKCLYSSANDNFWWCWCWFLI